MTCEAVLRVSNLTELFRCEWPQKEIHCNYFYIYFVVTSFTYINFSLQCNFYLGYIMHHFTWRNE